GHLLPLICRPCGPFWRLYVHHLDTIRQCPDKDSVKLLKEKAFFVHTDSLALAHLLQFFCRRERRRENSVEAQAWLINSVYKNIVKLIECRLVQHLNSQGSFVTEQIKR